MSRRFTALFLLAACAGCIQVLPADGEARAGRVRRAPANDDVAEDVATVERVEYVAVTDESDQPPVEIVAVEEGEAQECCESEAPGESCCQEGAAAQAAKPEAEAKADEQKLDDLRWAVEVANRRFHRANAEADQSKKDQEFALSRAQLDVQDARRALRHFEGVEKPARLAKAELDLKDARDYLTEQDEEMRQLELLYEKDDLGDKTKEIVLARGRRRHERAQQRFEMAQRDFEDLKGFELEQQKSKLARELEAKEREAQRASWNAKIAEEDKQQAIEETRRALAKAKRELGAAGGGEEMEQLGYTVGEAK